MRQFMARFAFVVAACTVFLTESYAQTAEQLELLNALPASQRQAILREIRQREQPGPQTVEDSNIGAEPYLIIPEPEDDGVPRLSANSTIVIEFSLAEGQITRFLPENGVEIEEIHQRLQVGNPYRLDGDGFLYLPGVEAIALSGLNVDEAIVRLEAEPALLPFQLLVTLLPLEPTGLEALRPFGYDVFDGDSRAGLRPSTDIPAPGDYTLGPGDSLNVQLFGNQNAEYILDVTREGTISFPEIGPIIVGGLSFTDARALITERVTEQMIGVRASISVGELRSIRVFVLGDVDQPGSYTVSGLTTITNALFVSGGVRPIGSLRRVQLKRSGETVSELDLYDMLLNGDNSDDARLQAGDVIFVPPIGTLISVDGEVRRPALYELLNEESLADAVAFAGGLTAMGDPAQVRLERIVPGRGVSVSDVVLDSASADAVLQDGDVIRVVSNIGRLESGIRLSGNVQKPGLSQWFPGMRLTDLIPESEMLKAKSDLGYVLIRREIQPNVFIEALSADLGAAWQSPQSSANIELAPRDTVHVFNIDVGRRSVVAPILEELRTQAPVNQPIPMIRIGGRVRAGGEYPLEPGMRISDLIRAGGGLQESAYTIDAELTRVEIVDGEYRETDLITVDLGGLLAGNPAADIAVAAHDYLSIKEVPRWREEQSVLLRGEVVFPGVYPIRQGESLYSVLQRAGGLTPLAFAEGSVFLRDELAELERQQLEVLAGRIETDLAAVSLSDPGSTEAVTIGTSLVDQLREAQPTGRLVIRLSDIAAQVDGADILLKDGDELLVPDTTQAVTVLGEVQYSTSHIFEAGLARDEYIQRSGGLTRRADDNRIYVVRANGAVTVDQSRRWFSRRSSVAGEIRPGDTIVVPLDTDRVRPLVLWTGVTSIIYNLAIAVAAINSF
jgi:polysaccharide biosynthesis/export protein